MEAGLLERLVIAVETIANNTGTVGWGDQGKVQPGTPMADVIPDSDSGSDAYQALVDAGDMTTLRAMSKAKGLTYGPKSRLETLADNLRKYDAFHGVTTSSVPPAPLELPDPFRAATTPPAAKVITQKDILELLQKIAVDKGVSVVYDLLRLGNVNQVADLKEADYQKVWDEAQKYAK